MSNARFRAYLSKYKEVLNQIWSRGRGGCNPLEYIGFYLISTKMSLNSRNVCVFIVMHHSFGFSDIFLKGVLRPQRPPGSTPATYRLLMHAV